MEENFSVSSVYQWTLEKDREEGIAIGEAQAQMLAHMRKRVMKIVIERFSSLIGETNEIVAEINDADALFSLSVNLAQAQSIKEAEQILLKAQSAR